MIGLIVLYLYSGVGKDYRNEHGGTKAPLVSKIQFSLRPSLFAVMRRLVFSLI